MNDRDELIKELKESCMTYRWDGQQNVQELDPQEVIKFILADRLRVVRPLVEWKEIRVGQTSVGQLNHSWEAIDETIRNAGVGND